MDTINCIIERQVYISEETGWTVLRATTADGHNIILTGELSEVGAGISLRCEGEWHNDARHGRSFQVADWEEELPTTVKGIEKFLGSGIFKGVGAHFARLIVKKFGSKTLEVIDKTPERLSEIASLGAKRQKAIVDKWEERRGLRDVMIFLRGHDISANVAGKIYARYASDTVKRVEENPYILADDIEGFSFGSADTLARELGFPENDPRRARAAILYLLQRLTERNGHVFATRATLVNQAKTLLRCDEGMIETSLAVMNSNRDIIDDSDGIYLPRLFFAERGAAKRIVALLHSTDEPPEKKKKEAKTGKREVQTPVTQPPEYDEVQLEAIRTAVEKRVFILTGGPGTGKTTVTRGIIDACREKDKRILLAAPTGRAAKRLSEATGMEAKTIHRLLEFSPVDGFIRDEENPLEGDVLIVDECSMIDIRLFYSLVRAIPSTMHIVLVGDIDQLPSVEPGRVLHDLIDSGIFPVVRLTRIFRQAQSSRIVLNAHAINHGELPDISNGRDTDFFFLRSNAPGDIAPTIVQLVTRRLPAAYGVAPTDIQVLTPQQKGDEGTVSLNKLLQGAINPTGPTLDGHAFPFRIGDKVMQTRNNYDKGIFNGDIGFVSDVDMKENCLTINFDGRKVKFESSEIKELLPAYAITIHKSQGSEFPIVVIPVTMAHSHMLMRNLLYTAITRARRICVLVGDPDAIRLAVGQVTINSRNSRLAERIRQFEEEYKEENPK